jgi:Ni/Co efflux regulator RcnB
MKKILTISLILTLVAIAATAQRPLQDRNKRFRMEQRFNDRALTRPERFKLRNDVMRYRIAQKRAHRDGRVGPMERRKLMMMRQHNRREAFRFRHNRIRRVI